MFWAASMIFYMLRKLSKAKFDLDSRSFELDSGDSEDEDDGPSPDDLTG